MENKEDSEITKEKLKEWAQEQLKNLGQQLPINESCLNNKVIKLKIDLELSIKGDK